MTNEKLSEYGAKIFEVLAGLQTYEIIAILDRCKFAVHLHNSNVATIEESDNFDILLRVKK